MARETSGGRIGRTVYLPPDVWDKLEALAVGTQRHAAFERYEIRSGSVSSVIEQIVTLEAAASVLVMQDQVAKANDRLREARDMQQAAAESARALQTEIAGIAAKLLRFSRVEL